MDKNWSDEMLMERYRDDDLASFKELYQRHSRGSYQFIFWLSPRKDWVDEIAQDTWARLHGARKRYQAQSAFRTYLYQIARNRLIDLLRQHQDLLASDMGKADDDDGSAFEHLADLAQNESSPEDDLEEKQRAAELHAAIRSLPGEQREALVLQQFNGMSLEEIAMMTVVSAETVKSRLRYAMRKLRQQIRGVTAQEAEA
ncbi:MAG: RNA polymerase subunit sigma-24 [Burkholderiales bacterium RIFCSPLOWO2_02_FULL_57_36]|nr:MAG: RNA polymerase subunit sigma-24 [Burkholderiales bacterium RIFCSPLOWO2_02_FULL_57_36]